MKDTIGRLIAKLLDIQMTSVKRGRYTDAEMIKVMRTVKELRNLHDVDVKPILDVMEVE